MTYKSSTEKQYYSLNDLPITLSVDDLSSVLGIGRNTAYKLVRSNQIASFTVGRQIRISKAALLSYMGIETI